MDFEQAVRTWREAAFRVHVAEAELREKLDVSPKAAARREHRLAVVSARENLALAQIEEQTARWRVEHILTAAPLAVRLRGMRDAIDNALGAGAENGGG